MLARFRENSDNLKNSLQIRETGFGELRPPPPSLPKPAIDSSLAEGPFLWPFLARGGLQFPVSARRHRLQVPFEAPVSGGKNPVPNSNSATLIVRVRRASSGLRYRDCLRLDMSVLGPIAPQRFGRERDPAVADDGAVCWWRQPSEPMLWPTPRIHRALLRRCGAQYAGSQCK